LTEVTFRTALVGLMGVTSKPVRHPKDELGPVAALDGVLGRRVARLGLRYPEQLVGRGRLGDVILQVDGATANL